MAPPLRPAPCGPAPACTGRFRPLGGDAVTGTIEVPLWLLAAIGVLAAWVVLERLLVPGVRWFFRRRVNAVIEEINRRARLRVPTFSLTKRRVLVDRLTYDPEILEAVRRHCDDTGKPWEVALAEVERYAREIVPAFNAWIYFRWGVRLSRRLVERLYRVKLAADARQLIRNELPANASVVFVMNHRSNMDYVFIAYLAEGFTALSYAVGEWARVWPLRPLVRAMGGYFVRRGSSSPLYRRVLERYVQMAVHSGVVQAVFPEGGLTRDGAFREVRFGLIDYMIRDHAPDGERDILFVPVALNYDRVIEDRNLVADPGSSGRRRWPTAAALGTLLILLRSLRRGRHRFQRMGYATASFGTPVSLNAWCRERDFDPRTVSRGRRMVQSRRFARDLMAEVGAVMPVLPVPMVAHLMLRAPGERWSREALQRGFTALVAALDERAPSAFIPRREPTYGVAAGLRRLQTRGLVRENPDGFRITPGEEPLLRYYANSIAHLVAA